MKSLFRFPILRTSTLKSGNRVDAIVHRKYILILLCCLTSLLGRAQDKALTMWYNEPASQWVEALPVGNGRLGAMVFGGTSEELIQLNEETLWSGRPVDLNPNPKAITYLPQVRKALFNNEWQKARDLCTQMQGNYTQSYLPMADVKIKYPFEANEVSSYYRDLNLNNAVATTKFTANGVSFEREVFVSAPDQVIIILLRSNKKGALSFDASLSSLLHHAVHSEGSSLLMRGEAPVHVDPSYVRSENPIRYLNDKGQKGMRFALKMLVRTKGGLVNMSDSLLRVSGADEAVLILSAATSFNGFDKDPQTDGKDELLLTKTFLQKVENKSYSDLKKSHLADYQQYFNRVSFSLGNETVHTTKDIKERLRNYREGGKDLPLETLYYQYGRYLLISSSRPGGMPANLQGIWNNLLRAPWSSNYTMNINAEMNYWPAEVCNLSELHIPFLEHIKSISDNGRQTALHFYNARGWALSHNSDIWGQANPVGNLGAGDPTWANWYMGSPWACQHLFEHYRYTGNKDFLRQKAYPIMKEAALFCIDWLIEDGNGKLITAPSTSPENLFVAQDGKAYSVTMASTMDMSLIWDLFTNVIEASTLLDTDTALREILLEKRTRLFPLQIGKKGNLQEWFRDYEDKDPHHRHVSHLFGLHPGRQISPFTTPDWSNAAKRSLELRGDNGTGWSLAWKINFWARLLDGDHSYTLLRNLLHVVDTKNEHYDGGGSYFNLFCAHPPFQIDGNFGGISGMSEMLLQSQNEEIHLLPALPSAWESGTINGICARNGFVINMRWAAKQLTHVSILSTNGGECVLRTSIPMQVKGVKADIKEETTPWGTYYLTCFATIKGKTYQLKNKE